MSEGKRTAAFAAAIEVRVRDRLLAGAPNGGPTQRTWFVLDVRSERRDDGNWDLLVLFRDKRRPGCTFGFRFADLRKWRGLVPEAGPLANICVANLEESIEAGDSGFDDLDCEPGTTVWV